MSDNSENLFFVHGFHPCLRAGAGIIPLSCRIIPDDIAYTNIGYGPSYKLPDSGSDPFGPNPFYDNDPYFGNKGIYMNLLDDWKHWKNKISNPYYPRYYYQTNLNRKIDKNPAFINSNMKKDVPKKIVSSFPQKEIISSPNKDKKQNNIDFPKKDDNSPRKHTSKSNDNGANVFITKCKKSLHQSLSPKIMEFLRKKRKRTKEKYKLRLRQPYIKNYLIKGVTEKRSLFYTPIKTIYEINNERLSVVLGLKEEDEDEEIKMLLDTEFRVYFEAFLNDEKSIIVNGMEIELENFDTLKDCFNEGKNPYSKKDKEIKKNYLDRMKNGEIPTRAKRKKNK